MQYFSCLLDLFQFFHLPGINKEDLLEAKFENLQNFGIHPKNSPNSEKKLRKQMNQCSLAALFPIAAQIAHTVNWALSFKNSNIIEPFQHKIHCQNKRLMQRRVLRVGESDIIYTGKVPLLAKFYL